MHCKFVFHNFPAIYFYNFFFFSVLRQNARKAVNTRFVVIDGLGRSNDQQTKGKSRSKVAGLNAAFQSKVQPQTSSALFCFLAASLWLRVHEQTAQNVHGHERERRPQQQVQQLHQDAGHGGGPGHQLPNLRLTGEASVFAPRSLGPFPSQRLFSRRRQKPRGGQDLLSPPSTQNQIGSHAGGIQLGSENVRADSERLC